MAATLTAVLLAGLVAAAVLVVHRSAQRRLTPALVGVGAPLTRTELSELSRPSPAWNRLRLALAVAAVVSYGLAAVAFQRDATLDDLRADVAAHHVHDLTLTPGLEQAGGSVTRTATWRSGLASWRLTFTEFSRDFPADDPSRQDVGDLAVALRGIDPSLGITAVPEPQGLSVHLPYGDTHLGRWLAVPEVSFVLLGLLLLTRGPEPWRATRWAWFWLWALPGGALLFLLLSGPTPRIRPPRPGSRRTTGGLGWLAGAFGGSIATLALAALVRTVLPGHY